MYITGPEMLLAERHYCSTQEVSNYWKYNNWARVRFIAGPEEPVLYPNLGYKYSCEIYGEVTNCENSLPSTPLFSLTRTDVDQKNKAPFVLDFDVWHEANRGYANTGRGEISGQNYAGNTKISMVDWGSKTCTIKTGDGTNKLFRLMDQNYCELLYGLALQQMPNGNQIKYDYDKSDNRRFIVRAFNKNDTQTFSSLNYFINHNQGYRNTIKASDGRITTLLFQPIIHKNKNNILMTEAQRPNLPTVKYEYYKADSYNRPLLKSKSLPNNRYLQTDYYVPGPNNFLNQKLNIDKKDKRVNRVLCQKAPVGTDATPITIYTFDYVINEKKIDKDTKRYYGYTDVYDALKHKTRYEYNEDSNLTKIIKYLGNATYTPYITEEYYFSTHRLYNKTLKDKKDNIIYNKSIYYTNNSNVTSETLTANFSGLGPDTITKIFNYDEEAYNLCTSVSDCHGYTRCVYKKGTNLIEAKYENQKREFFEYDINCIKILHIVDDGSKDQKDDLTGVTQRHITSIKPKAEAPCLGLPIVIEEKYLDLSTKKEKLISKKVNTYTNEGWLTKQECYDSNNTLRYTLVWKFNKHGLPIEETNAIGQTIYKEYDENDNLIRETSPSGMIKQYKYDFCNRLIQKEETDGKTVLSTTFRYDYLGNKISSTDYFGNETKFVYDDLGRLIETILPEISDENGKLYQPKILKTYDELNNVTSETDGRGYTITKKYNYYQNPYEISYLDGTKETFIYNLDGTCKKSIGKNGTYNIYTYDSLKRLLKQETFSPIGVLLSNISNTYNSSQLLSSKDAAGHVTYYTYDYVGRKKSVAKDDSLIEFDYDSLGRLYKTIEWYGKNEYMVKIHTFDLLNRVVEECIENEKGKTIKKIAYSYDPEGNRTQTITYTDDGACVSHTVFNVLKEPVKTIDPLGKETLYHYVYSKKGLIKTVVDSLGNSIETHNDALGRTILMVRKNSAGKEISKNCMFYDACGNKVKTIATVMEGTKNVREVVTRWEYDTAGRVTKQFDASGSVDQKITSYSYNKTGQKDTVTKSDGISLIHLYDGLSRLSRMYSSDNSVDYSYEYEPNGKPTKVINNINKVITERQYDHNDRLALEICDNALFIRYEYDRLGRPTKLILPDDSNVDYTYDALHLKNVKRSSQQFNYDYEYYSYDLSGHILKSKQINDLGTISYKYNIAGRQTESHSPTFNENHIGYDSVGNLVSADIDDELSLLSCKYSYDDLYQIKSEQGDSSHQYLHDSLNNRIEKDGVKYEVNSLNQICSQDNWKYYYDLNGNLIRKEKNDHKEQYIYDALDRLIEVQKDDCKILYTYDSFNRRLTRTIEKSDSTSAVTCKYMYVGQNEIGSLLNGSFQELRILGTGKGAEIGSAIALEIHDKLYAPIHDHNGNVRQLLDADTGDIVETYRYTAFGEERIYNTHGEETESSLNPWRFSSKRFDDETGFVYFGRRYYDPELGRWMTMDPLGYEAGPNMYAYVMNSPLFHFDLYGLQTAGDSGYGPWYTWPGQAMEFLNHHINCIPGLRQIGFALTSMLQFQRPRFTPLNYEHSKPLGYFETRDPKQNIVGYVNGMLNYSYETEENANYLSAALNNPNVKRYYMANHGFLGNLLDVGLMKLGFETEMVRQCRVQLCKDIAEARKNGTYVDLYAHSMGAEVLYNATKGLEDSDKKMLNIATFGGARMIPHEGFKSCYNYVNLDDAVPFIADPIGLVKGMISDDIIKLNFVKYPGIPLISHEIMGDAYSFAKEYHFNRMNQMQGI
jgi:RHS repeat-associated protein